MIIQNKTSNWKKRTALFLLSQNLSLFGSSVVGFAIVWHITLKTSSGVWMMLASLCTLVPQVLISLFGGCWADRYNRKHLILLADGCTALATLALAVCLLLGWQGLELLLAASVVRALGAGVQTPAVGAMYPQLVPKDRLTKVQGINQTIGSALTLLSPAIGGLLLGTVGIVGAFFVDVGTAGIAMLVMSRIPVEQPSAGVSAPSLWREMGAGVSYIWGHRQLRRLMGCILLSFLLITPAFTLIPLMIGRTFGKEVWRLTVHEIVWSVSMILGGVFVSVKGGFRDQPRTIAACILGSGVAFGLLGVSWNFASFLVFLGLAGFFWPVLSAAQTAFVQATAPPEVMGRVFSVIQIMMTGAVALAILFFGPLADAVRIETILLISSAWLALAGILYGWRERRGKYFASGQIR